MQTAVFSCHPRVAAAKGPASSLCAFGIPRAPATRGNDKQGFPHSNLTVPAKAETSHLRSRAIGLRYQFEQVTVGVIEIDATAAVEVINFARPLPHKVGVKHHAPVTEAGEPSLEFLLAYQEGAVMRLEFRRINEVNRDPVAGPERNEGAPLRTRLKPQNSREKARGGPFILGRNNDVVELDTQCLLPFAAAQPDPPNPFAAAAPSQR